MSGRWLLDGNAYIYTIYTHAHFKFAYVFRADGHRTVEDARTCTCMMRENWFFADESVLTNLSVMMMGGNTYDRITPRCVCKQTDSPLDRQNAMSRPKWVVWGGV